jgi:hypothetical protein
VKGNVDQISLPRTLYMYLYPRIFFPLVFGFSIFLSLESYREDHDKWGLIVASFFLYFLVTLMRIRLRITGDELISYQFRFFILTPPRRIIWKKIREIKSKSVDAGGRAKGVMLFILTIIGSDNEKPVLVNTTIFPPKTLAILAGMIETNAPQAKISKEVTEAMQRWIADAKSKHPSHG